MNKKYIKSLTPITRIVVVREGDIYVPGEYDLVKAKLQAAKKGDTPIRGYFELPVLSWMRKEKLKSGKFKFYKSYSSSNHMAWMRVENKTIQNSKVTSINQCSWEESPAADYSSAPDNPFTKALLKELIMDGLMKPTSNESQKED